MRMRGTGTYDKASFLRVLSKPEMLEEFSQFTRANFANESLRFYTEAQNWSTTFHDKHSKLRRHRSKQIFALFISPDGFLALNLLPTERKRIQELLKGEEALKSDLFDRAKKMVFDDMYSDSFARFMGMNKQNVAIQTVVQSQIDA